MGLEASYLPGVVWTLYHIHSVFVSKRSSVNRHCYRLQIRRQTSTEQCEGGFMQLIHVLSILPCSFVKHDSTIWSRTDSVHPTYWRKNFPGGSSQDWRSPRLRFQKPHSNGNILTNLSTIDWTNLVTWQPLIRPLNRGNPLLEHNGVRLLNFWQSFWGGRCALPPWPRQPC